MIRTGQMLLHEALRRHTESKHIKLFIDSPEAPFGIHRVAEAGLQLGRKPGEWFGPQAILMALKILNKRSPVSNRCPVPNFKIIVCNDGNIFLDKVESKLQKGNSVLLGVPLRLGIDKIQKEYLESLMEVFTLPENVGIAGG